MAAGRILSYRVHVVGSHGPDATYATRRSAEQEVDRLRRSGIRAVVRPIHSPLPSDPWLSLYA